MPSRWKLPCLATGVIAALLLHPTPASALQITDFSATKNRRFSSGFPAAPVNNTNASFVGLGYDFSGVGWASGETIKGFVMLSPVHFLATAHWLGAPTLRFANNDGTIYSFNQKSIALTGYGAIPESGIPDIAVGTLTQAIGTNTGITSYAIYDNSIPDDSDILLYGHGTSGPRVGIAKSTAIDTGNQFNPTSILSVTRTNIKFEGGDSGSPGFVQWTDPNGNKQLALVGNNAGYNTTENVLNFVVRDENIRAMNQIMAVDGYALRFLADGTVRWAGENDNYSSSSNWDLSVTPDSSTYVEFSNAASAITGLNLQGGVSQSRGLIFDSGDTSGYTFTNGTINLGRGGIHNYGTQTQTFSTNFTLTESQVWDGESGGLNVSGNINNGGFLLLVQGSATNKLSGIISGTGGLAKDGSGIMTVSGANTYSGTTFLHNGTLVINNSTGSGTGSGNFKGNAGTLAGFGRIAGNATLSTATRLTAGNITSGSLPTLDGLNQANNSLTFGGNLTLDGAFDFYLGSLSDTVGFTQIVLDGTNPLLALGVASSFNLSVASFIGIDDPNSGNAFWFSSHSWKVFDITGAGTISGVFGSINLGSWSQGMFSLIQNDNDFELIYTAAVPEPSTWAFAIGGVILIGFRVRSRTSV